MFRPLMMIAVAGLFVLPLNAQEPTVKELLRRIDRMEADSMRREDRIRELEGRLEAYEESGSPTSELETMIQDLAAAEVAQVTTPRSVALKIGGQLRFRGEARTTKNYAAGVEEAEDFVIQRTRLRFDFHVVENVRVFVELQDSRLWGEEQNTLADLEGVDIHQGFVDFKNVFGRPWTFRVGRQELSYGDQRLISPLDWHPVGRAFDGVKTWYEGDQWQLDLFVTNIDENSRGPDGEMDDDRIFAGLYFNYAGIEDHELDFYVLYRAFMDGSFTAEDGTPGGDLEDVTIGARFDGATDGFSYSAEIVLQLGDRAGDDVFAYAWAFVLGYQFDCDWKPKISIEWDFASGDDDPTDGDYETFDPLFAFVHAYQGYLDIWAWRNGHDFVFRFSVAPMEHWWMEAAVHGFLLDSDSDAWYNAPGNPIRRVPGGVSNHVGIELDLHAKHQMNEATALWFGYSHFFAGDYVDDTGDDPETDWVYFQMTINF